MNPHPSRIAILGAGAVGGYLAAMIARQGQEVALLCRPNVKELLVDQGLQVDGPEGVFNVEADPIDNPQGKRLLVTDDAARAVQDADLLFVCVKSQDTENLVAEIHSAVKKSAILVLMQNGVRNKDAVEKRLPNHRVFEAVVLFNALYVNEGEVTLTATESVFFDSAFESLPAARKTADLLLKCGITTRFHANVRGILWTKLIINLNNGITALTGGTLFEGLRDPYLRKLSRALMAEGMGVLEKAGIALEPIPKVDPARLMWLLKTPGWFAAWVMRLMIKPYQDVQSSTWQSRVRGRPTEIDYLNGEVVRLAKKIGAEAPLNSAIADLVHKDEEEGNLDTCTAQDLCERFGVQ